MAKYDTLFVNKEIQHGVTSILDDLFPRLSYLTNPKDTIDFQSTRRAVFEEGKTVYRCGVVVINCSEIPVKMSKFNYAIGAESIISHLIKVQKGSILLVKNTEVETEYEDEAGKNDRLGLLSIPKGHQEIKDIINAAQTVNKYLGKKFEIGSNMTIDDPNIQTFIQNPYNFHIVDAENAARELKEETGINVSPFDLLSCPFIYSIYQKFFFLPIGAESLPMFKLPERGLNCCNTEIDSCYWINYQSMNNCIEYYSNGKDFNVKKTVKKLLNGYNSNTSNILTLLSICARGRAEYQ